MKPPLATTTLTLIVLAAFGLLLAGCYTVLVHPTVETTGEDTSPRMCSDCHSSPDYYYWHFPYQYNWYSRNPSWGRYYHDPWWYDNYWYWKDDGGHGTPRAPQGHLWQPRVTPSGSQPNLTPGASGSAGGDSKSSGQGGGQSGDQKEESKDKHLFQPRVPPKDTEDTSNTDNEQPGKSDDSSKKKAEEQ
ncbi:MAG: hypothetical protein V1694_05325 [Candidatus Eisenbacteria bacterium]